MSRIRSSFVLVAGLAVAAALGSACSKADADAKAAEAAQPAVIEIGKENVVIVTNGTLRVGPIVSGTLSAAREATVRAEVGGSVLKVGPDEGEAVKRGQMLAQIDARTLGDAVMSAESALRSAEQALAVAKSDAQRNEELVKAGAIARRDVEVGNANVKSAEAQVEEARTRLATARKTLGYATVAAPMAGVVSKRFVNAGDVATMGTELYTIIDPSSMRLEAAVPSEQIGAVRVGAPVVFEVRGYPDQTFEGRVERISPAADATTRQVPIFVQIPNASGRLLAGLFAEGRVTREERTGLIVPATVISGTGDDTSVMRLRDGKVERVSVKLGLRDDQTERVEVASGIAAGDQLVVGAAQGLTPGTPVRVRGTGDPTAAPTAPGAGS